MKKNLFHALILILTLGIFFFIPKNALACSITNPASVIQANGFKVTVSGAKFGSGITAKLSYYDAGGGSIAPGELGSPAYNSGGATFDVPGNIPSGVIRFLAVVQQTNGGPALDTCASKTPTTITPNPALSVAPKNCWNIQNNVCKDVCNTSTPGVGQYPDQASCQNALGTSGLNNCWDFQSDLVCHDVCAATGSSGKYKSQDECNQKATEAKNQASAPTTLPGEAAVPFPGFPCTAGYKADGDGNRTGSIINVPTVDPSATGSEKDKQIKAADTAEKEIKFCTSVQTAIGDIETTPGGFATKILSILLGLAGGIFVILIIISGYRMMTSQGNPEAIKGGKETMTGAIIGLLFIILSIVLLQIITVGILHIPGFTN